MGVSARSEDAILGWPSDVVWSKFPDPVSNVDREFHTLKTMPNLAMYLRMYFCGIFRRSQVPEFPQLDSKTLEFRFRRPVGELTITRLVTRMCACCGHVTRYPVNSLKNTLLNHK